VGVPGSVARWLGVLLLTLGLTICPAWGQAGAAAQADSRTNAQASQPGPRTEFPYGVFVADLTNAPRAAEAGFRVLASTLSWRRTEPDRGAYPFEQFDQWGQTAPNDLTNLVVAARAGGLKLGVRIIDPPAWAGGTPARVTPADLQDYVYHLVRYAHDTLSYVELFNEPNLPSEWGAAPDPAGYARLIAAAYQGARQADPTIPVVSAGPSQRTGGRGGSMEDVEWLDGFLQASGGQNLDALGVHAYLGSFDPGADPSCIPLCFGQVNDYHSLVQRRGLTLPISITEFGALQETSTDLGQYNWMKLPPAQRADALVNAFELANVEYPWIVGATLFNLDHATLGSLSPGSEQFWFSLLNPDRSPRAAFTRLQQARASGELP
jgi:hypothetical protein